MSRILGIDYGEKRVGLSLSDPTHLIASPFETLVKKSSLELLEELKNFITIHEVEKVVVGIPHAMKGGDTQQTKKVRDFVNQLKESGINVEEEDERLSSVSAQKALLEQNIKIRHQKELVDQTAAAIILQQYLDRKRHA